MKRETKLISRQNLDFVCDPCLYAYGACVQAACKYEMVQIKHSQCFILIIKTKKNFNYSLFNNLLTEAVFAFHLINFLE